ncbi:MAG TPA: hypothetical protein VLC79_01135, partial [Cellvibrio sp.]|nr:hypothetical protein [Cellvibrio sp.]
MQYALVYFLLCITLSVGHHSQADTSLRLVLPKTGSLEPEVTSRFYEQALRLALVKTGSNSEQIQFNYYPNSVGRER